jgi:hypothetical protein
VKRKIACLGCILWTAHSDNIPGFVVLRCTMFCLRRLVPPPGDARLSGCQRVDPLDFPNVIVSHTPQFRLRSRALTSDIFISIRSHFFCFLPRLSCLSACSSAHYSKSTPKYPYPSRILTRYSHAEVGATCLQRRGNWPSSRPVRLELSLSGVLVF